MPQLGVDALTLAAVLVVFFARPPAALTALLATALLVPTPLPVPYTHFSYVTVQHVVAAAAAARLLYSWVLRRVTVRSMYAGPALVALGVVVAVSFVVGLVFSAGQLYSVEQTTRLLDLGTQIVFLVTCVVLVSRLGSPRAALTIVTGLVVVSAGIGFVEHLTNDAWGHWLFSRLPGQGDFANAALPLDQRLNQPRVRAGSDFALEFAWVSVMLLPAVVVTTVRTRGGRVAAAVGAGVVLTAVYWSYSRSALAFGIVALFLVAWLLRDSRAVSVLLVSIAAVGVAYLQHPSVTQHLSAATDENSLTIRLQRLDAVLGGLAHHPFRGFGLGSVSSGIHTTDNALLLEYAELGAFGLVALALLYCVVLAQCARAVAVSRIEDRPVAVACLVGTVAYLVGAQFYDAFTLMQAPQLLWFLVAVATVVARRAGAPMRLPRPSRDLVVAVAAVGVAVGGVFVVAAPRHVVGSYTMTTLPPGNDAGSYSTYATGQQLAATACGEVDALAADMTSVSLSCTASPAAIGLAQLRLAAPSSQQLAAAQRRVATVVAGRGGIGSLQVRAVGPAQHLAEPLWLSAAVLAPLGGLGLLLLVPWRRRRLPGPPQLRRARSRLVVPAPVVP